MLPAIILAAGASRRMGHPKALLPAEDGRPFIARIVRTLATAGLEDIVIVTGPDHDAIVEAVGRDRPHVVPRFVRNPEPERGQLSSLWVGMDAALSPSTEGMLVTLVDVPQITPAVVSAVVEAWRRTRAAIVRPAIGERHGHPVVFDRALFGELRSAPLDTGAKAVVRAHARDILNVPVSDKGCLIDVDTPSDYRQLLGG